VGGNAHGSGNFSYRRPFVSHPPDPTGRGVVGCL